MFAAEPDALVEAPDLDEEHDAEGGNHPAQVVSAEKAQAIIRKLHVNTGHASIGQMMRLANRCQASEPIKQAIRTFKCPVCDELRPPQLHRKVTMPHTDKPNQVVGVDFVQVELLKMG